MPDLDVQPADGLDVQPVPAGGLDVQPAPGDAAALDLQPVAAKPTTAELFQMFAPKHGAAGPVGFNYGGTPTKIPGDTALGEDFWTDLYTAASRPAVAIPGMEVKPTDHPAVAAGKEVVNVLKSIPEFLESPLGAVTGGAASIVPRVVAATFGTQQLYNLGQQVQAAHKDWQNYTPAQKAVAAVDMAASGLFAGLFAGLMAHGAVKGAGTASPAPVPAEPKEAFSEFGDDQAAPPLDVQPVQTSEAPSGAATGEPVATTPLDVQPVAPAPTDVPETERVSRMVQQAFDEMHSARQPLPATLVQQAGVKPEALAPGYALNAAGDGYEYTAPAPTLTPGQVQAREAVQAMAELRAAKETNPELDLQPAETPSPAESPSPAPAKLVPAKLVPVEVSKADVKAATERGERPPDILDTLGDHFPNGVKFSREDTVADLVKNARGEAAAQMSHTSGEASDKVLDGLHREGLFRNITTEDDLAQAMKDAGDVRINSRGAGDADARALAEDAKRAELWGQVNQPRPGSEPVPVPQTFIGDEFTVNGQPMRVTEHVMDQETGQPAGVMMEGAFGRQFLPAVLADGHQAAVHIDQGSLKSPSLGQQVIAKLDALKLDTNGQLHAFGLAPLVWNTLIDGVKLAVRGGMAVKDAIDQAIEKLKASGQAAGFDEAGARDHLTSQFGERATGLKVKATADVSDEAKAAINNWVYQRRTNAGDAATADAVVKQFGVSQAIEVFNHPPAGFPEAVRSQMARSIGRELASQEAFARKAGDTATAAAVVQQAGRFWDDALARSTELAQGLQAMRSVTDFSPDAVLARTRLELDQANQHELDRVRDQLTMMQQAMAEGRATGTEAVRTDETVNAAARAAVDETIKNSPETHQAVVMELAPVWAQSKYILDKARELVAAKANDLLSKAPRPPGFNAREHLRQTLDDLGKRAAGIFANHIQGAEPGVPIVDKLMQRLGVDRPTAVKLGTALAQEWDRQVKAATEKLDKRLAMQRAKQLAGRRPTDATSKFRSISDRESEAAAKRLADAMGPDKTATPKPAVQEFYGRLTSQLRQLLPDRPGTKTPRTDMDRIREVLQNTDKYEEVWRRLGVELRARHGVEGIGDVEKILGKLTPEGLIETQTDRILRQQLRDMNVKLGDVLRQAVNARDDLQQHIADRVVNGSGLKGPAAEQLRASLKNRWDVLVADSQKRALEAMANRAGVKVRPQLKSAFARLTEIDRLGGLHGDTFLDTVKTAMKLKQLTPADATKLRQLLADAHAQPEGFLRDQKAAEVLKFTEKLKGNVTWRDIPMAIFYANVLSGFTTPAKIAFENMNLLASTTVASLVARPGQLLHPIDTARMVGEAYKRGIVKGGLQAQGTLRSGVVSGIWPEPRHAGVLEMKPFGERLEPLNFWKWFTRGISTAHELTFKPSWEIRQAQIARDVAAKEGLAGKQLQQRVADLLANTPEAFAKARAQALKDLPAGNRLDVARRTREILEGYREENLPGSTDQARDFALRTAYLNEPYGVMGMIASGVRSTLEQLRQKFPIAGSAAKTQIPFTTIVANILNEKLNWTPVGFVRALVSEKTGELYGREITDPHERAELYAKAIMGTIVLGAMYELAGQHIHGNGPSDPAKRKQLQAAGWIPHSIEYHGRYYGYMNTPAALGLAVMGNLSDWERYGHGETADATSRASFVAKATAQALVSQGMLDSMKRFFEAIGSEDTTDGAGKLEKLAARTGAAFVVPNLVNQIDRMFDPTVYDQTGMKALVQSQVPFVRRDNKPVLNVLGEPVVSAPFHYWESKATDDALWRVLVAKQAFVPEPGKTQILGNPKEGPEYARAMTADEYYNWIAESGPQIRAALTDHLDEIATMPAAEAKAFVQRVAEEQRKATRPQF